MIQCTKSEMCAFFGVTDKTLDRWVKETYGESFSAVFRQKRGRGKVSLRRSQWRLAVENLNPTMLIFLGKQFLAQSDLLPAEKRRIKAEADIAESRADQFKGRAGAVTVTVTMPNPESDGDSDD